MSLKDTINNTNTQKENIKTVASNIDNKLVELGGERAKDLNDVANKMGAMVGQYKKIAKGEKKRIFPQILHDFNDFKIEMNLNFIPKIIICTTWKTTYLNERYFNGTADSRYNAKTNDTVKGYYRPFIIKEGSISQKNFTLSIYRNDNIELDVEWFAIG